MGRPQPYDPTRDRMGGGDKMQEDDMPMFETPANSLKVGATTDVKELASTITQACHMGGDIPALLTIGNSSINQAVKGIAAAAADLRAVGDLTFQPAFRCAQDPGPRIRGVGSFLPAPAGHGRACTCARGNASLSLCAQAEHAAALSSSSSMGWAAGVAAGHSLCRRRGALHCCRGPAGPREQQHGRASCIAHVVQAEGVLQCSCSRRAVWPAAV